MSSLREAILGLLMRSPSTGYELSQIFRTDIKYVWDAKQSQVYPELQALFAENMVDYYHDIRGTSLIRKRFFCTEQGGLLFKEWLNCVPMTKTGSTSAMFFRKMQFSDLQTPEEHREFVRKAIAETAATAARIRAAALRTPDTAAFGEPNYSDSMIWSWSLAREEAFLAWLKSYAKSLENADDRWRVSSVKPIG